MTTTGWMVRASALAALCFAATNVQAQGGRVLSELTCPVAEPMGMAMKDGHLWIADMATRSIVEVNPTDGKVLTKLEAAGLMPTGVAWHEGTLFAAVRRVDAIARRRPGAATDLSPIPYYERWATSLAHDGAALWVVDARSAKLHRVDPVDGTTIASFPAPADSPTGMTFDGRYLWVADHDSDELYRVDRSDGSVITILNAPGPYPSGLAIAEDSLWAADYQQRKLYRLALPDKTPYVEDQERRVRVSYEVLFRATGTGSVEGLTAYLAVPRGLPGQHLLGELSFSPAPTRFATDRWGQRVAVIELGRLAAGETRSVRWQGDFALFRVRFHIDPAVVDAERFPADTHDYLADDKKYDLESRLISEMAADLTAHQPGVYRDARVIYEHLTKVIKYDRSSGWNNAAAVLERGTGSCSEYTFALVALLRRNGIPARYVGAISERGDEASFDDVFHRWAEAYLPGYGWVPIDANAGHGKAPGERGGFFAGRSNRHVVTTIGGGSSELLDWTYNSHETYQTTGSVKLEVRPIARYRPLEGGTDAKPHQAPRVLAPHTVDGAPRGPDPSVGADKKASPHWWAAIAGLVALAAGVLLGRSSRRQPKRMS